MCRGSVRCSAFRLLHLREGPQADAPREWSRHPTRAWEYTAVLRRLAHFGVVDTLVNMAAGPAEPGHDPEEDQFVPMYRTWWRALAKHASTVIHTDLYEVGQPYPGGHWYAMHDVRDPWPYDPADVVLAVGVLDAVAPEYHVQALQHMLAACFLGGRLIATWNREAGNMLAIQRWLGRRLQVPEPKAEALPVVYLEVRNG